jgi:xanthine/CO dehydrogenase XdhC/CoxF family maturation factor
MDIYEEIVKLRKEGRRGAVATIVNVRGSIPSFKTAKMLVRDDGSIAGTIGGGCVEADVWQAAREVMESERPRTLTFDLNNDPKYDTGLVCGGTLEVFVEPVLPPAELYIFGAGHVGAALYRVARIGGFDVTVVDDREAYANRERFPEAQQVIAEELDKAMAQLMPSESTYIVVVTRGHRDDMRVLRWADDRVETEDDHDFQGTAGGRNTSATFRPRACARGPGYRGGYAGGDCSIDHGRADCEAAERGARVASYEACAATGGVKTPNRRGC